MPKNLIDISGQNLETFLSWFEKFKKMSHKKNPEFMGHSHHFMGFIRISFLKFGLKQ